MIKTIIVFALGFIGGTVYGVFVTAGDPSGAVVKIAQLIKALL